MKNKLSILILLLAFNLSGCNSWLDVHPDTEVSLKDMFDTQQGFQDALTGCYLDLKSSSIYGRNLMYGTIEFVAQHWDYAMETTEEDISRYNYQNENVQSTFSSIYAQLYSVIASANMILEQIDSRQDVFETGMYEIIKGEALAMRAFCHFDLLRLFGPMPTQTDGSRILPYVKTVSLDYHEHHTYEAYVAFLEADLLQVDSLLKQYDPIIVSAAEGDEINNDLSVSAENFLLKRQIRFNYYAVKGLEARFYLWLGGENNKAKAYQCAKEVIDAVDSSNEPLFVLGNQDDIDEEDYSFPSEHVLAIYDHNLETTATNFTEDSPYSKAEALVTLELYTPGTTDIRFKIWQEYITDHGTTYTIKKFKQRTDLSEGPTNQLPLIRLSEMFFIAMECSELAEANKLYEEFCIAKDIPVIEIVDEIQLENILIDEYNKEFYGEGQAFYAFKRLAVENILWAQDPGNRESYVVPLPQDEVSYNK